MKQLNLIWYLSFLNTCTVYLDLAYYVYPCEKLYVIIFLHVLDVNYC